MLLSIAVIYFLGIQSVASSNCPRFTCTSRHWTSRDRLARHVLLRCKLINEAASRAEGPAGSSSRRAAVGSPAPPPGWRAVAGSGRFGSGAAAADEPSTVAFVDGLCVTEYYLNELQPNASSSSSAAAAADGRTGGSESGKAAFDGSSQIQLTLKHLSGFEDSDSRRDARGRWPMVCNTTSAAASAAASFGRSAASATASWQRCAQRVPRLEIVEVLTPERSAVCVICTSISQPGEHNLVYHSISRSLLLRLVLGSASASTHTSSSSYASFVSSLSVTLNLFSRGPSFPPSSASSSFNFGPTSSGGRSRASAPPSRDRSVGAKKVPPALAECRWKCGWTKDCLRSRSLVCDGRKDCPNSVDEAWCPNRDQKNDFAQTGYLPAQSGELSVSLVYTLVTLGVVLCFVFVVCLLWAFCARSGSAAFRRPASLRRRHRRSHHQRRCTTADGGGPDGALRPPDASDKDAADCPLCASCCHGAFAAGRPGLILVEQPSTAGSSSGVFEESNASSQSAPAACPNCCACRRAKQWLGAAKLGLSDSSPAIPDAGGGPCDQNGGQRVAPRTPFAPAWPPNTPAGRQRPSLSDQSALPRPRPAHHHHRPSSSSSRGGGGGRRAPRPSVEAAPLSAVHVGGGGLFSAPAHHQDWLLNLPASVRRCNDDDPRQTPLAASPTSPPVAAAVSGGGSGGESGRLLPPPNLNPFLDVPHHPGLA